MNARLCPRLVSMENHDESRWHNMKTMMRGRACRLSKCPATFGPKLCGWILIWVATVETREVAIDSSRASEGFRRFKTGNESVAATEITTLDVAPLLIVDLRRLNVTEPLKIGRAITVCSVEAIPTDIDAILNASPTCRALKLPAPRWNKGRRWLLKTSFSGDSAIWIDRPWQRVEIGIATVFFPLAVLGVAAMEKGHAEIGEQPAKAAEEKDSEQSTNCHLPWAPKVGQRDRVPCGRQQHVDCKDEDEGPDEYCQSGSSQGACFFMVVNIRCRRFERRDQSPSRRRDCRCSCPLAGRSA